MRDLIKKFVIALLFFLGCFLSVSQAADVTYLSTSIAKNFKNLDYPYNKVETKITVKTKLNEDDLTGPGISRTRDIHKKFLNAFYSSGWNKIDPVKDYLDASYIEVIQEDRMNLKLEEKLVLKSHLYACESNPLWNMMKYRGGDFDMYLKSIIDRVEGCIISKHELKSE